MTRLLLLAVVAVALLVIEKKILFFFSTMSLLLLRNASSMLQRGRVLCERASSGGASTPSRADRGIYGGRKILSGNTISFSNRKNRRKWNPNVHLKKFRSDLLRRELRIKVTAHALRCIEKYGGIDAYLMYVKPRRLEDSQLARDLRAEMVSVWQRKTGLRWKRSTVAYLQALRVDVEYENELELWQARREERKRRAAIVQRQAEKDAESAQRVGVAQGHVLLDPDELATIADGGGDVEQLDDDDDDDDDPRPKRPKRRHYLPYDLAMLRVHDADFNLDAVYADPTGHIEPPIYRAAPADPNGPPPPPGAVPAFAFDETAARVFAPLPTKPPREAMERVDEQQ
jgi:large subunit ribosomal protein L28